MGSLMIRGGGPRRSAAAPDGPVDFRVGECAVDVTRGEVARGSATTHLEPRAMSLLVALAHRAGRTVAREELIEAVWGHPHISDEALSRCISLVRNALGDDRATPRFLETIPKRGYRLLAPVSGLAPPVASEGGDAAVAVLPFASLSADRAGTYFADGLTELLITNLACLPAMRVISRTSSMRYRDSRMRLTDIASELEAARVVEGSVMQSGNTLQVVVQLIDPATDTHLFTRTYTRDGDDLLRVQNEIAWTVASEIGVALTGDRRPASPAAGLFAEAPLQSYLRARHFRAQRTADAFAKAVREYEACIAAAPEFAAATACLAHVLADMAFDGVVPASTVAARSRDLAERAYAQDPGSAEALSALGASRMAFDWNLAACLEFSRRAVDLDPGCDLARHALARCHCLSRDFDSALREIHAAMRINPLDLGLQVSAADFLAWARRPADALAQLRRTLDIGPHFWPARARLAQALAASGDEPAAREALAQALPEMPHVAALESEAAIAALCGDAARARAKLQALEALGGERYVAPLALAQGHAILGDSAAALSWIDAGIAERSPMMLALGILPAFDRIAGDASFAARMRAIRAAAGEIE